MRTCRRSARFSLALVAATLLLAGLPGEARAEAVSPVGYWKTIDDETHKPKAIVQVWEHQGVLYGRIIKLFRAPNEEQNPKCTKCSGSRKDKPIIGLLILQGLRQDDGEWSGGTILDPEKGKTYKCILKVEKDGRLKVRGYIGFSLLGRTQYWYRVSGP